MSKEEYLKRYLSGSDASEGKKKKKKKSKTTSKAQKLVFSQELSARQSSNMIFFFYRPPFFGVCDSLRQCQCLRPVAKRSKRVILHV